MEKPPESRCTFSGGSKASVTDGHTQSHNALHYNSGLIDTIINTSPDAVIITDEVGIVEVWNPQAEIIFGWSQQEALGRQMAEMIIPHEYRAAHNEGMQRFLETGEHNILNQRIEITALNKQGVAFPVELTVTSHVADGKHSFTAFVRDISERKNIEQALETARADLEQRVQERTTELAQSKAFLRTIIDTVADPIFVKDRQHRWVEGNTAFWSLIGTEETIKGKSDFDIFPKEQAEKFWEGDERVFSGELFNGEERLRKPDGEDLIIATKKVPFTLMDGSQGLVGVIRDVTEQRQLEQELRKHRDHLEEMVQHQTNDLLEQKERAEAANIAKSEFLANMSHEIRTPMNAIIGLAGILSGSQPITAKQKEYIQTLQMSADALLALINDLLDISKIEARSVELEMIPFDFLDLVQDVMNIVSFRATEKNLWFHLNHSENLLQQRRFIGDSARLRQVFLNLFSNAIKFTEQGGVNIDIGCQIEENTGQSQLKILIRDTGIGIARDKLDLIFEKFVQADSSVSRKYGGTGLGLAITKTLIEIMGGKIHVESHVGNGSVFTVHLPLAIDTKAGAGRMRSALAQQTGNAPVEKTILLVEDYAPNILVAGTLLERFGYEYDTAVNGIDALEKAKARRYDAIIMDVQMPGMDGFAATRAIRDYEQAFGLPRVPIIALTAYALNSDRARCLEAGMDDYIAKPFSEDELQRKLEQLFAKS